MWALEPIWTFWRRGISAENGKSVSEFGITVRSVFVLGKTNPKLFGFHLVFLGTFAILRNGLLTFVASFFLQEQEKSGIYNYVQDLPQSLCRADQSQFKIKMPGTHTVH